MVDVRVLPGSAAVKAVERLDYHGSGLAADAESMAAPGSYRLTIGRGDALVPGARMVNGIAAP